MSGGSSRPQCSWALKCKHVWSVRCRTRMWSQAAQALSVYAWGNHSVAGQGFSRIRWISTQWTALSASRLGFWDDFGSICPGVLKCLTMGKHLLHIFTATWGTEGKGATQTQWVAALVSTCSCLTQNNEFVGITLINVLPKTWSKTLTLCAGSASFVHNF